MDEGSMCLESHKSAYGRSVILGKVLQSLTFNIIISLERMSLYLLRTHFLFHSLELHFDYNLTCHVVWIEKSGMGLSAEWEKKTYTAPNPVHMPSRVFPMGTRLCLSRVITDVLAHSSAGVIRNTWIKLMGAVSCWRAEWWSFCSLGPSWTIRMIVCLNCWLVPKNISWAGKCQRALAEGCQPHCYFSPPKEQVWVPGILWTQTI